MDSDRLVKKRVIDLNIKLFKKPKNPIIIEGFPGFGLVSTIACEFLIDHLKTELIGKIVFDELPAMVAIHENRVVEPLGIFYNKKYNVIIVHAVTTSQGFEWKLAEEIIKLADKLEAKEIVCIEGVGSAVGANQNVSRAFYYASDKKKQDKLREIGLEPLKEGIIMGVTGALLTRTDDHNLTCIFSEAHSTTPDSKAAAKVIESLDKYLDLDVNYGPLVQQAAKFEDKLRNIMTKSQKSQEISDAKKLSYVG